MQAKFIYTGIHVSNFEKSLTFYKKTLGIKLLFKTRIKETGGRVAWLTSRGSKQILELNWYPKSYKYGGKSRLAQLGLKSKMRPLNLENLKEDLGKIPPFEEGRWVLAHERPNGNWIELGSRLRKKK